MNIVFKIILPIIIILGSCRAQNDNYKTIVGFKEKQSFSIKMPHENCNPYIVQYYDSLIITYFYGYDSLYVYNISNLNKAEYTIPLTDYHMIHNFKFINNDSIWVNGEIKKGYDHPFELINKKGEIKRKINIKNYIHDYNFKDDYVKLNNRNSEFIYENKLFFTLYYYLEDGKNAHYEKHPLIGYYDILKDKVVLNNDLYFPIIKDGIYYPVDNYMRYCPQFTVNDKKGDVIISFFYTPYYYVWNLASGSVKMYKAKSLLIDTIMPFNKPISKKDDEYRAYEMKLGGYFGMNYLRGQDIFVRSLFLPEGDYGKNRYVHVFIDGNYNYLGEVSEPNKIFLNNEYIYFQEWNNDSLILVYNHSNGYIHVSLGNLIFKEENQKEYTDSFKSLVKKYKEQKQNEICQIVGTPKGEDYKYKPEDILKYVSKQCDIKDTSFSLIILNEKGCSSCNNYYLEFLMINKNVLFSLSKPLYLLYVNQGSTVKDLKQYILKPYCLDQNKNVKTDTSLIYDNFNPFSMNNPRLLLVKSNKVISDTVYTPDNLEKLIERLLDFYHLEKK